MAKELGIDIEVVTEISFAILFLNRPIQPQQLFKCRNEFGTLIGKFCGFHIFLCVLGQL